MDSRTFTGMRSTFSSILFGSGTRNAISQDLGKLLLRVVVGLAFCTVFEKLLPTNGVWGPQEWFVRDVANMGFPLPVVFAWAAVLSEFIGGLLLMLGLLTRPAALANAVVTFTATVVYHGGDIADTGLLSFVFLVMCLSILLLGPGRFSLDRLIVARLT